MSEPRTLLLFDPQARPQSWNERMKPGEYATLYSSLRLAPDHDSSTPPGEPFCHVLGSLPEAEDYARRQVTLLPTLACRIYDHHGFGRQPIRDIRGDRYKGEKEISPRTRRWWGSGLLLASLVLFTVDWNAGFGLLWPAMFATRLIPVALILLVAELAIYLEARRKNRRSGAETT